MGTTVTAAGVFASDLYLTQIGDSRAYLVRNGDAIQLTKDQSLMQRLIDAGEMTEEEAERSERRNIILQALGPEPRVKVDLTHQSLRRRDLLIVCSDGLSTVVKKEEVAQLAAAELELPALCSALIDLANERGGPDNITVVAARFDGDALEEPESTAAVGHQVYDPPEAVIPAPPHGLAQQFVSQPPAPGRPAAAAISGLISPLSIPRRGLLIAAVLLALLMFIVLVGR